MVNKNHRLPYRALASSYTQTTTRTVCRAHRTIIKLQIQNLLPSTQHTLPPPTTWDTKVQVRIQHRCAHKTFTPKTLPVYCPHPPTPSNPMMPPHSLLGVSCNYKVPKSITTRPFVVFVSFARPYESLVAPFEVDLHYVLLRAFPPPIRSPRRAMDLKHNFLLPALAHHKGTRTAPTPI